MNLAHAADLAFAAASPPGGGAGGSSALMTQVVFFAAIFGIFYFLLIRPQQKQKRDREAMISAVKPGDRVVTSGGMHAVVTKVNEQTIVLRVADQVKVEFDRGAIGRIVPAESQRDRDA
jgi:preprotein translocase subunit YajC